MFPIDRTGQRFGKLLVIKRHGSDKWKHSVYQCVCDCGNATIVSGSNLHNQNTKSCGCLQRNKLKTHGGASDGTIDRLYQIWKAMNARCHKVNGKRYHNYGGRGIAVDPTWRDYATFRDWALSNGYHDPLPGQPKKIHLDIDRKNNDGPYSPANCHFIPRGLHSTKSNMQRYGHEFNIMDHRLQLLKTHKDALSRTYAA